MTSSRNLTVLANNATARKEFVLLTSSIHAGVKSTLTFLSIVMMVFGVSANLFVLSVKVQHLKSKMTQFQITFRRSVTSYLMISLSISDILTAIFTPTIVITDIYIEGMHRGWPCRISRFIVALSFATTIHNLLLISIEQYLGTFHWGWLPSPLFIKRAIVLLWIEAFLVSFTSFAFISPKITDVNSFQYTFKCQFDLDPQSRIIFFFSFLVVYAVPLAFMTYSSFAILHFIRNKTKTSNLSIVQKHELKKARIFTNVFYAFILPYSYIVVYGIITLFIPNQSAQIGMSVRYFGALLAFSNCCINPLIYFFKSSVCRKMLMEMLGKNLQRVRCPQKKNKVDQQPQIIPLQNTHDPLRSRQTPRLAISEL